MLKTAIFQQGKVFIAASVRAASISLPPNALSVASAATYSSIQSETMISAFAFVPFAA